MLLLMADLHFLWICMSHWVLGPMVSFPLCDEGIILTMINLVYPPHDWELHFFFDRKNETVDQLRLKYLLFLAALLHCVTLHLPIALEIMPEGIIPVWWSNYLAQGVTTTMVGPRQQRFYDEVTVLTTKVQLMITQKCLLDMIPFVVEFWLHKGIWHTWTGNK